MNMCTNVNGSNCEHMQQTTGPLTHVRLSIHEHTDIHINTYIFKRVGVERREIGVVMLPMKLTRLVGFCQKVL